MDKESISFTLIENQGDFDNTIKELADEPAIGVDLEADSMFHYHEKVCLVQISTRERNILIDPLSLTDLSSLSRIFSKPDICNVFHGADYDIRSLYRDFGIEINSLFDTQLAARFLGLKETGLAYLLKEYFNILVEKKYQRKDWSKRPLSANMLNYAIRDSCFLLPLKDIMERELRAKGRLSWLTEECEHLRKVRPALSNNSPLFLRLKGAGKLDPVSLGILESILQFREREASRRDLPPFKILGNTQALEIANKRPQSLKELGGLSPKQIRRMGQPILKIIKEIMIMPQDDLPTYPRKTPSYNPPGVLKRIRRLKDLRERYAKKLDIDISLLCTNSQIESLALTRPLNQEELKSMDVLRNWQRSLLGEEICSAFKNVN